MPGALSTSVEAISKSGKIVGEYYDGSQSHAFEYADGTYVRVDPAGAVS